MGRERREGRCQEGRKGEGRGSKLDGVAAPALAPIDPLVILCSKMNYMCMLGYMFLTKSV